MKPFPLGILAMLCSPSRHAIHRPLPLGRTGRLFSEGWGILTFLAVATLVAAGGIGSSRSAGAAEPEFAIVNLPRSGTVQFRPTPHEDKLYEKFRLAAHEFSFEQTPLAEVSDRVGMATVTFPSPMVTKSEANNTVHCELFYPKREGKVPAVVVLHILGGDFDLARLFANNLAQHGVAALFLKMPYYGPRRDPGSPRRMISQNPEETVEGMTQAVLDIRHAIAWLGAQPNIDPERLGIFGISLGGITGALAATAEPRIQNVCLLLAGADLAKIAWESKELEKVRTAWLATGGSKDEFIRMLQTVDPARYGENVRGKRILLLNATHDEVIPKACTMSLWESFGKPDLEWYSGGHYSVARHMFSALHRTSQFFGESPTPIPPK